MKRVLVVHPRLTPGGGSEARPLWIAEALKENYDVTLVSQGKIDLPLLNKAYGTSIGEKEIKRIELSPPPYLFAKFDAYRSLSLIRFCQERAGDFDILISSYNVLDFKKRGVQFIADFSFSDKFRKSLDPHHDWLGKLKYEFYPLRAVYLKFAQWLSRTSSSGWRQNLTVANSRWTQQVLRDNFNLPSEVIYPPVFSQRQKISWEEKEDGFVILGRIIPEKRIEQAIEIVKKVRERLNFKALHLHLIGGAENKYFKKLRHRTKSYQDWIFWEGPVYGSIKFELLQKHKYGLHCRPFEPFGIAVAEMIKSGCLVWVPKGGGQEEIVSHLDLIYNHVDDAVEKIVRVLEDEKKRVFLQKHLEKQALNFSTETFIGLVKELISRFE